MPRSACILQAMRTHFEPFPTLHTERGLDLSRAGLVSAMPSFGMVVTLIAWGYLVDRIGERVVLSLGSALTAAAAFSALA